MQSVCLCVRYTVHGASIWTNRDVLGSFCQINTWTAAESGDSKHSSFLNIPKCIQLVFLPESRVCHCVSAVLQYVRQRVCMYCFVMTGRCHSWASQAVSRVFDDFYIFMFDDFDDIYDFF